MKCSKIRKNAEKVTSVFDHFKSDNPLLVRRKFQMKDVCFRKDHPEVELFRWEIAWDAELYVLLLVLTAACAFLVVKTVAFCCRTKQKLCRLAARKDQKA